MKVIKSASAKLQRVKKVNIPQGLSVFSSLAPVVPSEVYDTYWRFAAERQEIFFRRFHGTPPPFTSDPILQEWRFTNAYRAADRVSQFLIRRVSYAGSQEPEEVFFRTILFRLFNKIETWFLLENTLHTITYRDYNFRNYDELLTKAMRKGSRIYSAAYIMPPGSQYGHHVKHRNHLQLLERMMSQEAPSRIREARSMREAFEYLRSFPMIGDFLAYQFVIDLNYGILTNFSEMEFVVPGPGARSGILKSFVNSGGLSDADLIRLVTDRQDKEFSRLGLKFKSLWGRPLHLIDCQNLFCEVDKYARIAHPKIRVSTGRTRIKQRYKQSFTPLEYWFPPKWAINDRIGKDDI